MKLFPNQQPGFNHAHGRGLLAYISGFGGGKSVSGSHYSLANIDYYPKDRGLIFANTNKQLNTATLPEFMKVLDSYQIHENQHYVINKNPTPIFKYKSLFPTHEGVWSFMNGAQVLTYSLESQIAGITVGWMWGDELQDADYEDLKVVLGRLRGSERGRAFFTLIPPEGNPEIEKFIYGDGVKKGIPRIEGSTYDNTKLPDDFIPMLESVYDSISQERLLKGHRVNRTGKAYAYSFDKDKHVSVRAAFDPGKVIIIVFDFNVDPFVCTMRQHGRYKNGQPYIHIVDELSQPDSNIYLMCDELKVRYMDSINMKAIEISGDPTGKNRNIYDKQKRNAFQIIIDEFHLGRGYLKIPAVTRNIDDRILFNSILEKHPEFLINPKCVNVIRDMQFVKVDNYGQTIKRNRNDNTQQADPLDTIKYGFQAYNSDFIDRKAYAPPVPIIPLPPVVSLKNLTDRLM